MNAPQYGTCRQCEEHRSVQDMDDCIIWEDPITGAEYVEGTCIFCKDQEEE